jgi:integrase
MGIEEYTLTQMKLYKANIRDGAEPKSPKEKRKIAAEKAGQEFIEQERQAQEAITFGEIFTKKYFPITKQNKTKGAWTTENSLFKLWVEPIIGALPPKEISPIHLDRIKKNMTDAGKTPRTTAYALSIVRQAYNCTINAGLYSGKWPGANKAVKIPKKDNCRQRFLTHTEAVALLAGLKAISPDVHDMALWSLHCGLRAGEVFSLTWADIDSKKGTIFIRDPKSGRNRFKSSWDMKASARQSATATCHRIPYRMPSGRLSEALTAPGSRPDRL